MQRLFTVKFFKETLILPYSLDGTMCDFASLQTSFRSRLAQDTEKKLNIGGIWQNIGGFISTVTAATILSVFVFL